MPAEVQGPERPYGLKQPYQTPCQKLYEPPDSMLFYASSLLAYSAFLAWLCYEAVTVSHFTAPVYFHPSAFAPPVIAAVVAFCLGELLFCGALFTFHLPGLSRHFRHWWGKGQRASPAQESALLHSADRASGQLPSTTVPPGQANEAELESKWSPWRDDTGPWSTGHRCVLILHAAWFWSFMAFFMLGLNGYSGSIKLQLWLTITLFGGAVFGIPELGLVVPASAAFVVVGPLVRLVYLLIAWGKLMTR